MAERGKGYTTLFRELGTPEGDFHAEFTKMNHKNRDRAKDLASAYRNDARIQRLVQQMEADRAALWEAWKRGLPTHLRKIVDSVREPHHGPNMSL